MRYRHASQKTFGAEQLDQRLKAGLIGHWIGGGSGLTLFDRSGYRNHGTLTNGPTWTLGADGRRYALNYDGSNDYVDAGNVCNVDSNSSISISVRIKARTLTSYGLIVAKDTSGRSYSLAVNPGNTSHLWTFCEGVNGYMTGGSSMILHRAIRTKEWEHIVFVYDHTAQTLSVYLNGTLSVSASASGSMTAKSGNLRIGAGLDGFSYFDGEIDDLRIYNRPLSSAEAALLGAPSFQPVISRSRRHAALSTGPVEQTSGHTIDALLKKAATLTNTIDALLKKSSVSENSIDALLVSLVSESKTHTLDALLIKKAELEQTIDALLRASQTSGYSLDSLLNKSSTLNHTLDAFLKLTSTGTHTIDALLKKAQSQQNTIDALLIKAQEEQHTLDALLKKGNTAAHTVDALLKETNELGQTLDALLIAATVKIHTINALLIKGASNSHTIDALIVEADQLSHTIDALLAAQRTAAHTVDALLIKQSTKQHTLDSYIQFDISQAKYHTLDAFIAEAARIQHTLDAYLKIARVLNGGNLYLDDRSKEVRLGKRSATLYLPKRSAILKYK